VRSSSRFSTGVSSLCVKGLRRLVSLRALALGGALLVALLPTGCGAMKKIRAMKADFATWRDESPGAQGKPLAAKDAKSKASADKTDPQDAPTPSEVLAKDQWELTLPLASAAGPVEGFRWQHRDLQTLLAGPADSQPDLQAALLGSDRVAVANAAITLARRGDGAAIPRLVEAVQTNGLRIQQRQAAAESLAALPNPTPVPALRQLLDQYGKLPPENANYVPQLHAELLRGLSRHVAAADDPQFTASLRSPNAEVRREALAAWSVCRKGELPQVAVDLRTDPSSRIRADAVGAIVAHRHPQAQEFVQASLADYQVEVRQAAVVALGKLGGPESQRQLEKLLVHQPDLIRAKAILALAELGARDKVDAAASDSAWRVRQAVAETLASHPDAAAMEIARKFFKDSSSEVQKQTIASLEKWPLPVAGPMLLTALETSHFQPRKMAAEQLTRRWPAASTYSIDAPAERRIEMQAALKQQWSIQFGSSEVLQASYTAPAVPKASQAALPPSPARVEAARQLLARLASDLVPSAARTAALQELADFGSELEPTLAIIAVQPGQTLPEIVYREILPRHSPSFVALDRLTSTNVDERRRAADRLREIAQLTPLSSLALSRMAELGIRESDALVWRSMLLASGSDASEPAVRLAYAVISHPSPEIRRMACDYLNAHPNPAHAPALLPALADDNPAVVHAVVRALGHPGVLGDPRPLEQMLVTPNKSLRVEIAISLSQLNAPSGPPALERLAHDTDAEIRRRAATAMGQKPNPIYTPTLMGLLDDMLGVQQAALTSLPQVVGFDVSRTPDPPATSSEQVSRWKKWWAQQQASRPN
jgi:HEAT repeat protein